MKQGFEERQIARAKVIFSARLFSSAGFFRLRFLIHKSNPCKIQIGLNFSFAQESAQEVTTSAVDGCALDLREDGRD